MTIELKKLEVMRIFKEIKTTDFASINSINLLLEYAFKLSSYHAFTGESKAEAKQILHRKRQDYLSAAVSKYRGAPTTIIKDYINDLACEEIGYLELCDRANSSCQHTIDLIRTAVSSLKEERRIQNYGNS